MDEPFLKLLKAEIARKKREVERYEKALAMLELEEEKRAAPQPKKKPAARKYARRLGNEKLNDLRKIIKNIAKEQNEFRQVDIRSLTGMSSGQTAIGFDLLVQENTIRVARRDGNSKYYRLTNSALRNSNNGSE